MCLLNVVSLQRRGSVRPLHYERSHLRNLDAMLFNYGGDVKILFLGLMQKVLVIFRHRLVRGFRRARGKHGIAKSAINRLNASCERPVTTSVTNSSTSKYFMPTIESL